VSLNNYPIPALCLRWLYVDFNSYFASVEQQLRAELRGKPIAVVPVETDSTCAIAASYEAKAFGVKTGTPIYEAKRLCPGLVCVLAMSSFITV
jgi:DNA polymerase IV